MRKETFCVFHGRKRHSCDWIMNETTTRQHYSLIIGNTEITRTVSAAWSNTVKYRPKNQCYIIKHYLKKERRYTLWRYVSLCAHPERWVSFQNVSLIICPTQSPNNKLTEMREHFLFCFYIAHLASCCKEYRNLSLLPILWKSIIWCFWYLKLPGQLYLYCSECCFIVVGLSQMLASVG